MRIELWLFLIAAVVMANIYTEGKLLKTVFLYKKYYQMAGVAIVAIILYWLFKKNPAHATQIIQSSHEYLKYMPVDKNATNVLSPILDFTSKYGGVSVSYTHLTLPTKRIV